MRIIPAIDIIDGKCVRLSKGDYETKKIYNENPVEVAKEFEDFGIQYLHLVDLDGAKAKKIINQKVIENIAKNTNIATISREIVVILYRQMIYTAKHISIKNVASITGGEKQKSVVEEELRFISCLV